MRYKELSNIDKSWIKAAYKIHSSKKADRLVADKYDAGIRTVQRWKQKLGLTTPVEKRIDSKVLIYDLETSRVSAKLWWSGKQYVHSRQLQGEPKIITVAWKWLGENVVHYLTWDKEHSDEDLVREFAEVYNSADMVVGQNNDNFDNRWLNARCFKYGIQINTYVRSFDIMKKAKKLFRLPGYSMAYITQFLGVTVKQSHEGIKMWQMVEEGTAAEQKEYLQKMIDYNIGDIVSTEEMYIKIRNYGSPVTHLGVLAGEEKWTCPNCGGDDVSLFKTTTTAAGTIQRIMVCNVDQTQFKLSNTNYIKYLER